MIALAELAVGRPFTRLLGALPPRGSGVARGDRLVLPSLLPDLLTLDTLAPINCYGCHVVSAFDTSISGFVRHNATF